MLMGFNLADKSSVIVFSVDWNRILLLPHVTTIHRTNLVLTKISLLRDLI